MKSTTLYDRMKKAGFGYRACATAINAKFGSDVHYYDVYKFVTKNFSKVGKERRKIIRDFFISKKWIAEPKKRPAPVCRFCGHKYPTRKLARKILVRNHKRTTKKSHR
ncbi:MAG: hypothetical protein Q8L88_02355 [Bacteroidota bacterium]|nr:hypothetical protein [Bacteroidota bacterium]